MLNLTDIISKLQSDKVKTRQEALGLLEEAFVGNSTLINALGTNTKEWLAIFRALFAAVRIEKAACAKKGFDKATPASLARLEKTGTTVRTVTGCCISILPKKVVRELLNHLVETMLHRGHLVSSLSLNYVKTILELCSHRPHLEHLTTEMWISLASLAFAAILGDNLSEPRGFGDDELDETSDIDMDVDQTVSYLNVSPRSRKRRRNNSPPAQQGPSSGLPSQLSHTASPEQIDLMALLVVLLRSPYAPFSTPGISQKILIRLHRFFVKYSTWGNAHHAAIVATNVVLDQVELNLKGPVTDFALKMWALLLSYWPFTRKSKAAKEEIMLTMTTLLPFITLAEVAEVAKNGVRERVEELYSCLDDDLRHSSGFEGLSLESLRLRLHPSDEEKNIFEADTFRSGFAFGSSQALSWVTLELHADCVQALHVYSERFGSPVKRRKIETPLSDMLVSIRIPTISSKLRSHQLQVLLFVIDRHWAIFHESLQQEVSSVLIEVLAFDDPLVQSWAFLCLAAIVSSKATVNDASIDWAALWSHSVRRTNVLNVCRAASHAAHVLLSSQRLPVHRVLTDIEAFSNDLVVQGPTFPYDSVCAFICDCLRIASQDMRLHRIQLPEKVLSWISENWSMTAPIRSLMPAHTVGDVLTLLEATCAFSKPSQVACRFVLPDSAVVEAAIERHRTMAIRGYILHSRIPPFHPPSSRITPTNVFSDSTRLAAPTSREIKVSNFLFKSLDLLYIDWQNVKDMSLDSKPEKIRCSLDAVILSLCFEASLMRNGSQYTRRVVQLACKLMEVITPCLDLPRWNDHERALILMGLEPLVFEEEAGREDDPWDLMPGPGAGSGLKRSTLVKLGGTSDENVPSSLSPRRDLQRVIWQSVDVQDTFEGVMKALRNALRIISKSGALQGSAKILDQDEAFVPAAFTPRARIQDFGRVSRFCIQVCMTFLASAPILQSETFNSTRDKELTEIVLNCEPPAFLALAPEFLQAIRKKQLHVSISTADKLKDRIHDLLTNSYDFARGVAVQSQAIQFLHSTSHIWMQPAASSSELSSGVRLLNAWFSTMILEGNLRSWRVRDRLICFLDHHITIDPRETFWTVSASALNEDILLDESQLPSKILPKMADDKDTRVRFRAAVANARLLCTTNVTHSDPMEVYARVKNELSTQTNELEHMLSRFIYLGNAMISSSEVRRGPYWHLLEVTLFSSVYNDAVGAVLSAVADRLGLPDLRTLSEAYSSQLVESVILSDKDFFGFPHSLLGYDDRRQCAHATFPLVAPLILQDGRESQGIQGVRRRLFEEHCSKAQKSVSKGLFECLADIVGTRIVHWIEVQYDNDRGSLPPNSSKSLLYNIHQFGIEANSGVESQVFLRQNLDRIIFAIIRTVCDVDHSKEGPIAHALRTNGRSERAALTFAALTSYRKPDDFKMHHPNLPAFSALTVLRSLDWLSQEFGEVFTAPVIYHILHHLFAAIGRSMLINEQMRLLQALSLWISITGSSFRDGTLLRTLIVGATVLLAEYDLARSAQGILEWAFRHYASLKSLEPKFPDLLGRISRIAHDYSRENSDPLLAGLGNELLDWIEKLAFELSKCDLIKPQILKALPLWPRYPGGLLAQLSQGLYESQPLSDVLQNQHVKSGKFRLVRRLRDLAELELYTHDRFCKRDFWNLKSCIPPEKEIQDEDIDAFVDILFKSAGQIIPLQQEIESSRSVPKLHQAASWKLDDGRRVTFKAVSPKRSIILSLLDFLSTEEPTKIHRAHITLRLILALSIPDLANPRGWPSEFSTEISYLSTCPLPTVTARARSLEELRSPKLSISMDFPRWVCEVTLLLNEVLAGADAFYAQLSSLIESDSSFAAQVLPVLVHGILCQQGESRTLLSGYFCSILLGEEASPSSRQMVVEVVLHLRNFVPQVTESEDPLAHDKWLDIDFRLLSRGAMSCGAYTTALLFLELAADYSISSPDTDSTTEEILYEIYGHIEEPDGFYAIKSNDVRGFLTRRFHHEGQWDKAYQFHGAEFAAGFQGMRGTEGILQSLHSNGFDQLAMAVLQSSNSEAGATTGSSELGYEIAWRTELWDLPDPPPNTTSALYTTLRAVHRDRDPRAVDILLRNALRQEMSHLHETGIEDMVGIKNRARTLVCLGEIKKWRSEECQERIAVQDVTPVAWADFVDISTEFEFTTLESIIATRMSLLRSIKQREQREQIGDMETPFVSGLKSLEQRCLVRLSQAARLSENHQIALNASIHAQRLQRVPTFDVSQEFANVLWLQKEHKLAVEYLKGLVSGSAQQGVGGDVAKNARILSQIGTWSAEACLQKPTDIREQYFHRATNSILGSESQEVPVSIDPALAVVFYQYALFAEEQYHAILRSPEVERLKLYVERKKHEIEQIKESMGRTQSHTPQYRQLSQYQKKAEAIYGEDVAQFSVHTETRLTFLVQAIEMYSQCLQASDEFDDSAVIRLCSLWFANFNDDQMQWNFNRAIERVPSRKFIFLAHQLSARLSKPDAGIEPPNNQKYLQSLILRMCKEHPFHSLYQVWALQEDSPDSSRRKSLRETAAPHKGRARAAADILAICRLQPQNAHRVRAIEQLCAAYLQWAKYPLKDKSKTLLKTKTQAVPANLLLGEISKLPVPVTTAHTPLDYSLRYDNIVTIVKYSSSFTLAGGNNLPKISECVGSDGHRYKQLFKGEGDDDLRQDAVMEQVFELVNVLLKRNRQTRKRQLSVRCYKVIPLAPQAGLLEFVENTMPIGQWLSPAHERYHPRDVEPHKFSSTLREYRARNPVIEDPTRLRDVFLGLLERFRPVFRHFFTERNKLPMAWFATRLNYARSAATTSIVGHVLGLGDRHVSNILIDKSTGELVHIDLGIAFDQGKRLPIPELVPFRLTRDMVDGLGTAGTEGVFRRCAEETLRVLRAESGVITTVLEVFRHDPLHSWTASAIKIQRIQGAGASSGAPGGAASHAFADPTGRFGFGLEIDMESDSVDENADRALTSVHRKLDRALSVEYTVNELIVSATDPMNLSQIFAGWSPHL